MVRFFKFSLFIILDFGGNYPLISSVLMFALLSSFFNTNPDELLVDVLIAISPAFLIPYDPSLRFSDNFLATGYFYDLSEANLSISAFWAAIRDYKSPKVAVAFPPLLITCGAYRLFKQKHIYN